MSREHHTIDAIKRAAEALQRLRKEAPRPPRPVQTRAWNSTLAAAQAFITAVEVYSLAIAPGTFKEQSGGALVRAEADEGDAARDDAAEDTSGGRAEP